MVGLTGLRTGLNGAVLRARLEQRAQFVQRGRTRRVDGAVAVRVELEPKDEVGWERLE